MTSRTRARIWGGMLLWMCLGITTLSYAQSGDERPERQTVYSMADLQEVIDQIALGVVMGADVSLVFDRSDNSYLLPLSQYLETEVISQDKSATLYPKKMAAYILDQMKHQLSLNQIGPLLVDAYKQQEIDALKTESAQIAELRGQDVKGNLDDQNKDNDQLNKDYDLLIKSIEGLMANGAQISLGNQKLDWNVTPIPQILARIHGRKEMMARKAAQTSEKDKKKGGVNR